MVTCDPEAGRRTPGRPRTTFHWAAFATHHSPLTTYYSLLTAFEPLTTNCFIATYHFPLTHTH
jgi:hypothetical protein